MMLVFLRSVSVLNERPISRFSSTTTRITTHAYYPQLLSNRVLATCLLRLVFLITSSLVSYIVTLTYAVTGNPPCFTSP